MDTIIEIGDPDQQHQPKQKRFWSYIKSLQKDTGGVAPLKDNGRLHADPKEKVHILNRQYESTWTREDKTSIQVPDCNPFPSMEDIQVTNEGITKLLQKLNPEKSLWTRPTTSSMGAEVGDGFPSGQVQYNQDIKIKKSNHY